MDLQFIIVALIVVGAMLYAGSSIRRKVRSFKPKAGSCGAGCGCGKAEQ